MAHSPAPRFQPSTHVVTGTGPNYKACSSREESRGSWTRIDGRTHSFDSPHASRCRRPDAGGSPDRSWLNTGGEDKSPVWYQKCVPDTKQDWFVSFLKTVIVRSGPVAPLPQSTPPWSSPPHRPGRCSSPHQEDGSGLRSTSHEIPDGCGPHTAGPAACDPLHMTYCTVGDVKKNVTQVFSRCSPCLWNIL